MLQNKDKENQTDTKIEDFKSSRRCYIHAKAVKDTIFEMYFEYFSK